MKDDLDLAAVAADAALLDALAAGTAKDDAALAGLVQLRRALDADLAELLATAPAPLVTAPLQAAPVGDVVGLRRPTGGRSARRAAALVAGAALALSSTGVAAATVQARPGDAFYDLRTAVAGPRPEDPALLAERLAAVQRQVTAPDAAARERALRELAEIASLLDQLNPALRVDLVQRHAALTERLAGSAASAGRGEGPPARTPAGPPADVPAGPPAGVQPGPAGGQPDRPAGPPTTTRPPGARSESRAPQTAPPAQRPSAEPAPDGGRPAQGEQSTGQPSAPQSDGSRSPRSDPAAPPADDADAAPAAEDAGGTGAGVGGKPEDAR